MAAREQVSGKVRNTIGRWRWLGWVALGMGLMFLATSWNPPLHVDSILVAYPYSERSLIVERSGNPQLFHNSRSKALSQIGCKAFPLAHPLGDCNT